MERTCARCGEPAEGFAAINGWWYCHPDDESLPDCYSLATLTGPMNFGDQAVEHLRRRLAEDSLPIRQVTRG